MWGGWVNRSCAPQPRSELRCYASALIVVETKSEPNRIRIYPNWGAEDLRPESRPLGWPASADYSVQRALEPLGSLDHLVGQLDGDCLVSVVRECVKVEVSVRVIRGGIYLLPHL